MQQFTPPPLQPASVQLFQDYVQKVNNDKPNVDLSQKPDVAELSYKKDKKNIGKFVAIFAAAAVAIGIGIYAIRHGIKKGAITSVAEPISRTGESGARAAAAIEPIGQAKESAKTFIGKNGAQIEGVRLSRGKAIAPDNSMFTGVMNTTTKSGNVSIEYVDGYMTKSTINGELFKTYENVGDLPRSRAFSVTQHGKNPTTTLYSFYDEGQIMSKSRYLGDTLESACVYDDKGELIKRICKDCEGENKFIQTEFLNGRTIKSTDGTMQDKTPKLGSELKFENLTGVRFFGEKTDAVHIYSYHYSATTLYHTPSYEEPYYTINLKNNDPSHFCLSTGPGQNSPVMNFAGSLPDNSKYNIGTFTKDKIEKAIKFMQRAVEIARNEGLSGDMTLFEKSIGHLIDYAKTL